MGDLLTIRRRSGFRLIGLQPKSICRGIIAQELRKHLRDGIGQ
jgi:hypothetical protein